ncbi:acetyltransferase [Bdellovibrio bacteriovorus]|uniref:acetyltransferase n=1 Tax=Bdellovibrio bacteriovorus TaxID=959 RepID=UPI0035A5E858
MLSKEILIVGAGGHAKVVTELINESKEWQIAAYIDESCTHSSFYGAPIMRTFSEAKLTFPMVTSAFVALGDNDARQRWQELLEKSGYGLPWIAHSSSVISSTSLIGSGTLIAAKAFIGAQTSIGKGCIINTGCIVDHDVTIGNFTHLSQAVTLCGGSKVGGNCTIGPGSVLEKLSIVSDNTQTIAGSIIDASQHLSR